MATCFHLFDGVVQGAIWGSIMGSWRTSQL